MPNIWHLAHQTPKKTIMRCVKCQKILRHAIVCSHLWHDTDENAKPNKSFFIQLFLSPLNILFNFFSLSNPCSLSFFFRSSDSLTPSPSLTDPLTLADTLTFTLPHPHPHQSSRPHRSSYRHHLWFEDSIAATDLKLANLKLRRPPQLSLPIVG